MFGSAPLLYVDVETLAEIDLKMMWRHQKLRPYRHTDIF